MPRDLARVGQARAAVGDRVEPFVDANGGYSVGQAVRVEQALRKRDVRWFEEPVSSDDPRSLAAVRRQSVIDVAAGEYVWSRADAEVLLEADAVDCLQLDVTRPPVVVGALVPDPAAPGHGMRLTPAAERYRAA